MKKEGEEGLGYASDVDVGALGGEELHDLHSIGVDGAMQRRPLNEKI
jgi:hypothetical protein